MQFFAFTVVVQLIFLDNYVFASFFKSLLTSSVFENAKGKDYDIADYQSYLNGLLKQVELGNNTNLSFPLSLTHPKYVLFEGKLDRYYDPSRPYGFYENILFHRNGDVFYGTLKVFPPQIEFNYKYETRLGGAPETGSFFLNVRHEPIDLQMVFGLTDGRNCKIDKDANEVEFSFNRNLLQSVKYAPDSSSGQEAAELLVKELLNTWIPDLYQVILKIKIGILVKAAKNKMLTDRKAGSLYRIICQKTTPA